MPDTAQTIIESSGFVYLGEQATPSGKVWHCYNDLTGSTRLIAEPVTAEALREKHAQLCSNQSDSR